jgi:hypothetical protein
MGWMETDLNIGHSCNFTVVGFHGKVLNRAKISNILNIALDLADLKAIDVGDVDL